MDRRTGMVIRALRHRARLRQSDLATRADVSASIDNGMLRLEVGDDGIGGADPSGHGGQALDQQAAIGTHNRVPIPLAT